MAFNSRQSEKVCLEMAVLRYRAVVGTASMSRNALSDGVILALQNALNSYKRTLEKVSVSVEKDSKDGSSNVVSFVGNNHFICGWPMLTFDIRLIKKRRLLNSNIVIRIYVACDMLRNSQVKSDTIQYCKDNNIVVIDNLFQFCQPEAEADQEDWRSRNAENEILDQIHRNLKNGALTSNNKRPTRHNSCSNASTHQKNSSPNLKVNYTVTRHSTSTMPYSAGLSNTSNLIDKTPKCSPTIAR